MYFDPKVNKSLLFNKHTFFIFVRFNETIFFFQMFLQDDELVPKSTEQWLNLLQKQERIHEMELDKWHDMLGVATELLRQVCEKCRKC